MLLLKLLALGALAVASPAKRWDHPAASPKVMIISMFDPEDVWAKPLKLTHNITVAGTSPLFPNVRCNAKRDICQMITGEGEINAAVSVTSVLLSDAFDLRKTYFLVAGIAGVNPHMGTLGSVGLARYAVQVALAYELDARQIPDGWRTGYWLQGSKNPDNTTGHHVYGTEVFELNTNLRDEVFAWLQGLKLNDSDTAATYRAKFDYAPANAPPTVFFGDVATSDVYFTGSLLCEAFGNITDQWTKGNGKYALTAQEDNATFEAMVRAHVAGKMDFARVVLMRTASDFDREPPNMTAHDAFFANQGGFGPALANIYIAGKPIVDGIIGNWKRFAKGIQPQERWVYTADPLQTLSGNTTIPTNFKRALARRGRGPMSF